MLNRKKCEYTQAIMSLDTSLPDDALRFDAGANLDALRLQGILDSQIDFICCYTPETILTYVNDAYCRFFGKRREDLIGTSFLQFVNDETQFAGIMERIALVKQDPTPDVRIFHSTGANGQEQWIQWVDYGIRNANGQVIEIQAVGRDITSLIVAQTKLAEREQQAHYVQQLELELEKERTLRQLKERFLSMVSHEFRNPLAIISTVISSLMRYQDRYTLTQITEKLDKVQEQVQRMTELMEDVLKFGKLQAGRVAYKPQVLQLLPFCRKIIETFELVNDGQHPINFRFDGEVEQAQLWADPRLLDHILSNLIANAMKYSAEYGEILFDVAHFPDGWQFVIQDHGMGIPPEALLHIFEPFYRANNTHDLPGTGLGLSIVKEYVDLHGGSIKVESQLNVGTTFTILLPAYTSKSPQP